MGIRPDLGMSELAQREEARFFCVPRASGMEGLAARFHRHAYAPHTHDTFVIGTVLSGCETFLAGGQRHYLGPGQLCLLNPGVVHDGEPVEGGFVYRILYPGEDQIRSLMAEVTQGEKDISVSFDRIVVDAPDLSAQFAELHGLAERGGDALLLDTGMHGLLLALLSRFGRNVPCLRAGGAEPGPVRRALDYLDASFAEPVSLSDLAAAAGIARTRLIRAMRRETGMTPHAWLTDRRVRAARSLLAQGSSPASVAQECGFYDQSHLTRAFRARVGMAPGAFRASLSSKPGEAAVR